MPSELVERPTRALASLRERVRARRGGALAWRVGVTVVGVAVVAGGVVLLPLPGPGWLIIFAGLGLLATEYEWASRLLRFARTQVRRWTTWIGSRPLWLRAVLGLATAVVVVLVVIVAWEVYRA